MNWYELLEACHDKIPENGSIDDLKEEHEKELAALWRLEADLSAGGYIQFYTTWGRITFKYVHQALDKIGAERHAKLLKKCQKKIDKVSDGKHLSYGELHEALSTKKLNKIMDWSDELIELSDSIPEMGMYYYGKYAG